jgi:hypothetical protein
MYTHSRKLLWTAGALVAVIALPAAARAQAALEPILITGTELRADKLDAEAARYEASDWGKLAQAARLRALAADLRTADDPKGPLSLFWAARDRYYSGDTRAARELMERAADRAMVVGDVWTAATAYTEAAYISAELRDVPRARLFASKAKLLTSSPMLSEDQRTKLRTRLAEGERPEKSVAVLPKR